MNVSHVKSLLLARFALPARRKFRDAPAVRTKSDISVVRLIGFFLGGILLANLVLMTSAAFRGHTTPSSHLGMAQKRGSAAPLPIMTTDGRAQDDEFDPSIVTTPKPALAALCVDHAREKLTAGLTQYYLQRGLRLRGYPEILSDAAGMTVLLAGPAEPSGPAAAHSCTG